MYDTPSYITVHYKVFYIPEDQLKLWLTSMTKQNLNGDWIKNQDLSFLSMLSYKTIEINNNLREDKQSMNLLVSNLINDSVFTKMFALFIVHDVKSHNFLTCNKMLFKKKKPKVFCPPITQAFTVLHSDPFPVAFPLHYKPWSSSSKVLHFRLTHLGSYSLSFFTKILKDFLTFFPWTQESEWLRKLILS